MEESTNKVSLQFSDDLPSAAVSRLVARIEAAAKLGLFEITVTTVVTPRFETSPAVVTFHLDAREPVAPSRALASTRASR